MYRLLKRSSGRQINNQIIITIYTKTVSQYFRKYHLKSRRQTDLPGSTHADRTHSASHQQVWSFAQSFATIDTLWPTVLSHWTTGSSFLPSGMDDQSALSPDAWIESKMNPRLFAYKTVAYLHEPLDWEQNALACDVHIPIVYFFDSEWQVVLCPVRQSSFWRKRTSRKRIFLVVGRLFFPLPYDKWTRLNESYSFGAEREVSDSITRKVDVTLTW